MDAMLHPYEQRSTTKKKSRKNAAAKLEWRAIGRIECLLKVMSGKGSKRRQSN